MKKILVLLLSVALLCPLFVSCATKAPEIDSYSWRLASVSTEESGITTMHYVSDGYVKFFKEGADLPRIDCTLSAKRGRITITNKETGEKYYGIYENGEEFSPDATAYDITFNATRGKALVLRSAESDGDDFYSLSLSIGGYTLFFMKK